MGGVPETVRSTRSSASRAILAVCATHPSLAIRHKDISVLREDKSGVDESVAHPSLALCQIVRGSLRLRAQPRC